MSLEYRDINYCMANQNQGMEYNLELVYDPHRYKTHALHVIAFLFVRHAHFILRDLKDIWWTHILASPLVLKILMQVFTPVSDLPFLTFSPTLALPDLPLSFSYVLFLSFLLTPKFSTDLFSSLIFYAQVLPPIPLNCPCSAMFSLPCICISLLHSYIIQSSAIHRLRERGNYLFLK